MLNVVVHHFNVATGKFNSWHTSAYWSKKGRLCFRYGAGLFQGMPQARLGQFQRQTRVCKSHPQYSFDHAVMYLLDYGMGAKDLDYALGLALFYKSCARILKNKLELQNGNHTRPNETSRVVGPQNENQFRSDETQCAGSHADTEHGEPHTKGFVLSGRIELGARHT